MERPRKQKVGRALTYPQAMKSFLGYLEGTDKARHTISNYRLDLLAFQRFLGAAESGRLSELSPKALERFSQHLAEQGLKNNTRRRKLLTVQRFLGFLSQRNKVASELGRKFPTPAKIERVPRVISTPSLIDRIRGLPTDTLIEARNRSLLWTLAETGCLVSEVGKLRVGDWGDSAVHIPGKSARVVRVSAELAQAIQELQARAPGAEYLFSGFNKFGSLGGAITPRGVELLVKAYAPRLELGELTPRILRHSAVVFWHSQGASREEIRVRLGLKTDYAFRAYDPILKSSQKTTSSA